MQPFPSKTALTKQRLLKNLMLTLRKVIAASSWVRKMAAKAWFCNLAHEVQKDMHYRATEIHIGGWIGSCDVQRRRPWGNNE